VVERSQATSFDMGAWVMRSSNNQRCPGLGEAGAGATRPASLTTAISAGRRKPARRSRSRAPCTGGIDRDHQGIEGSGNGTPHLRSHEATIMRAPNKMRTIRVKFDGRARSMLQSNKKAIEPISTINSTYR